MYIEKSDDIFVVTFTFLLNPKAKKDNVFIPQKKS